LLLLPRSFLFFFHPGQRSVSLTSGSGFSFYTNLGTLPPAFGITEEAARTMGCDLANIKTRGDRYRTESYESGGPGYVVPSVGDTGCDVFAKLGRPDDIETITTEFGEALNFWYQTGTTQLGNIKMHLVVLGEDDAGTGTVVTSVAW
jgi:hypothetical protein